MKETTLYVGDNAVNCPVYYWQEGVALPELPPAFTIKLKHNGEWIDYKRLFTGLDIETTNIEQNDKFLAFMYHWQFSIATGLQAAVIMGRTWAEFLDFMDQLQKRYELSKSNRMIVWIANTGFEFQFIRKYFDWLCAAN